MAFNVIYSFNNGAVTGTATDVLQLRQAIYNYAQSGSVSDSTGGGYSHLTQCTLSGTAEGQLTTGSTLGTTTGTETGLFSYCISLTSVDLSNLDTSNVTNMNSMFTDCMALESIKVNKKLWNTDKVTSSSNMFYNCYFLPNYTASSVDKTKAIDKSLGGYLNLVFPPNKTYRYYEHYSDGEKVIPKSTDMFDFVTQEDYDSITSPDPDMLYFIIE